MQVGRWNHQASDSNVSRAPSAGASYARTAPPRRSGGDRPRSYGSAPRSYGYGRPQRPQQRRNFSSFGETESEIAKFMNKAVTVTEEEPAYAPEHLFSDFAVEDRLKKNILAKGYDVPTPIQDKAIPHALLGQDIVGLAETGTGKTAAFLIPLIHKVITQEGTRVLVMAPTRELAVQIEKELAGFARGLGFRGMVAVGGANIAPQISALRYKPAFVIGTPGRLKDLAERRALDFTAFNTVVLDEADRMLDMGFIDDMRFILGKMSSDRHTLFFSATMSKDIERLIGEFLSSPVIISVKTRDTSKNVDQDVVRIPRGADKMEILAQMLQDREFSKVLVFVRTKHGAERLAKDLSRRKIFAESIHGDKTHNARMRALETFRAGKVTVLVATDVAARGLDIPAVSHVINYDLPGTYEDYVHRIGRTGRASLKGKALTFVPGR
jgi:superfamily II DNA/RNA helicase